MSRNSLPRCRLTEQIKKKLCCSLIKQKPELTSDDFNNKGRRVNDIKMNLLPSYVSLKDFECDFCANNSNELKDNFLAPYSSSALVVNCFAPFRCRINELALPVRGNFNELQFEKICPISNQSSSNSLNEPHLDVLLSGETEVIGIESKLTEYIQRRKSVKFSKECMELIPDEYIEKFFDEMHALIEERRKYEYLDAAQLIKHALGLTNICKGEKQITLLYIYWQPEDHDCPEYACHFQKHREEIEKFKEQVNGSKLNFHAISYPRLWDMWSNNSQMKPWLSEHISNLKERYSIRLCD